MSLLSVQRVGNYFLIHEISSLTGSYMYVAHSDDSHQNLLLSPYNPCQFSSSFPMFMPLSFATH